MGQVQPQLLALLWLISFVAGLPLMLLMRRLTHRIGLVDQPDPTRKLHRGAISLGGGLALLATTAVGLCVAEAVILPWGDLGSQATSLWPGRWVVLAVAAGLITLLGLVDDRYGLRGHTKLLCQFGITALVAFYWQPSGNIDLFGWSVGIGVFSGPLLMFWLLATINAVNLIDGADGVTAGYGVVAALGIAAIGLLNNHLAVVLVATVVSAALASFLVFNRPPATIFLGDCGSMLVGLLLGALAVLAVTESGAGQKILIPIALLAVPLFDSGIAVLRRLLTGRSIYTPDRGHLHHLLASWLEQRHFGRAAMMPAMALLATVTSIGAMLSAATSSDALAILTVVVLIVALSGLRIFGHAEARLLLSTLRRLGGRSLRSRRSLSPVAHISGVTLQGNHQWDEIWEPLVEFAERNDLTLLKLDLNMPWLHEGYHGSWAMGEMVEPGQQWSLRLPVICTERIVGRLDIAGRAEGTSQIEALEAFSFLIGELQPAIEQLVGTLEAVHDVPNTVAVQPRLVAS